jgi:hypothetical protein
MKNLSNLISVPETFFFSKESKLSAKGEVFNVCGDCFEGESGDSSEKRIFKKFNKDFSGIKLSMSMDQLLSYRQLAR